MTKYNINLLHRNSDNVTFKDTLVSHYCAFIIDLSIFELTVWWPYNEPVNIVPGVAAVGWCEVPEQTLMPRDGEFDYKLMCTGSNLINIYENVLMGSV